MEIQGCKFVDSLIFAYQSYKIKSQKSMYFVLFPKNSPEIQEIFAVAQKSFTIILVMLLQARKIFSQKLHKRTVFFSICADISNRNIFEDIVRRRKIHACGIFKAPRSPKYGF